MPFQVTDLVDDPFAKQDANKEDWLSRLESAAKAENPSLVPRSRSNSIEVLETAPGSKGRPRLSSLSALPTSAEEDNVVDAEQISAPGESIVEDVSMLQPEESTDSETDGESDAKSVALDEEKPKSKSQKDITHEPTASTSKLPATENKSEGEDTTSTKRKRKAKELSPPPRIQKPQTTIRLSFDLCKPSTSLGKKDSGGTWEFNLRDIADQQGQIVHQLEPEHSSASEDEEGASGAGSKSKAPAMSASTRAILGTKVIKNQVVKKREVVGRYGGYDTDDSFVDDEELYLDMVTEYAVPKRAGYFIATGVVELKEEEPEIQKPAPRARAKTATAKAPSKTENAAEQPPPRKRAKTAETKSNAKAKATPVVPKGKVFPAAGHTPRIIAPFGGNTRAESPAVLPSSQIASSQPPGSAKKDLPLTPLSEEVQTLLEDFKLLVAKESFVPKNKFPTALEQPLFAIAFVAIRNIEYDDNFFLTLTSILPYNKFTLTKLIKRKIFPLRIKEMNERQAVLKADLKKGIERNLKNSRDLHSQALVKFSEARQKWEAEKPAKAPVAADGEEAKEDLGPQPPKQKFKFDDEMRQTLYEICTIDSSMVDLEIEKITLEKSDEKPPHESTARKKLYAELVSLWPEGWISSKELSAEWSAKRKKVVAK